MTVSEMEGAPGSGLECWVCTKRTGEGKEGPPPIPALPPSQAGPQQPGFLPPWGLELPPRLCLPARSGAELASCIINSTASLPVFTLITCWGGQVGGREQGGKPWSSERPSPLSRAALRGLAQPQVSEVGFWSFPHVSPQEGIRALRREFMWEVGTRGSGKDPSLPSPPRIPRAQMTLASPEADVLRS